MCVSGLARFTSVSRFEPSSFSFQVHCLESGSGQEKLLLHHFVAWPVLVVLSVLSILCLFRVVGAIDLLLVSSAAVLAIKTLSCERISA